MRFLNFLPNILKAGITPSPYAGPIIKAGITPQNPFNLFGGSAAVGPAFDPTGTSGGTAPSGGGSILPTVPDSTTPNYTGTTGTGGTGGTANYLGFNSAADLQNAQDSLQGQYNLYNHNQDLAQAYAQGKYNDIASQVGDQRNQVEQQYGTQVGNLNTQQQQLGDQLANLYAARGGGGEDTAFVNARNTQNSQFQQAFGDLQNQRVQALHGLDQALSTAQQQLAIQRQNLEYGGFTDLADYQAKAAALNTQLQGLQQQRDALGNRFQQEQAAVGQVPGLQFNQAQATASLTDNINKMIAAGTNKQQIRGFIRQGANKDELKSVLDYYLNLQPANQQQNELTAFNAGQ